MRPWVVFHTNLKRENSLIITKEKDLIITDMIFNQSPSDRPKSNTTESQLNLLVKERS